MADDDLLALIAATLGIEPALITEASDISNTRTWDSMRHILLMMELEEHYGIELTDRQILETTSVAAIRTLLATMKTT